MADLGACASRLIYILTIENNNGPGKTKKHSCPLSDKVLAFLKMKKEIAKILYRNKVSHDYMQL